MKRLEAYSAANGTAKGDQPEHMMMASDDEACSEISKKKPSKASTELDKDA
jgi:hypothetical protein